MASSVVISRLCIRTPCTDLKAGIENTMGANTAKITEEPASSKKLKPCCACPETKKARDTCIIENGEENCKSYIEAHKECMRKMGFNV